MAAIDCYSNIINNDTMCIIGSTTNQSIDRAVLVEDDDDDDASFIDNQNE
jgi:hypothetical protein